MKITLTQDSLDWLESHNISLHNQFGVRLKPGDNLSFRDDLELEPYVGFHAGNSFCEMGAMSYSNSPLPLYISVERYSSLAMGIDFPDWNHPINCVSTSIFTHDHVTDLSVRFIRDHALVGHTNNLVSNPQKRPVRIENDVWIGQNAALMAGVTVKNGSIVAAHSVVTKDVEPFTIVGGNPAKLIRPRFSDSIVEALLKLEWWNYKFTDFNDLDIANIEKFIDEFSERKPCLQIYQPSKIKITDIPR